MGEDKAQSSPQSSEDTADDRPRAVQNGMSPEEYAVWMWASYLPEDRRLNDKYQITATVPELCKLLASYLAEQEAAHRLDELQLLADSTAPRKDKETWKDWCFRVSGYLEKRLAELARLRKQGE